jgi:hypothetical protein
MRKVGLGAAAALIVLAVSFVTPASAFTAGATRLPGPAGPDALARSTHATPVSTSNRRTPATVASVTCDGQFDAITSANGTGHTDLFANAIVSANDVWSVGIQTNASDKDRTLAEHWNGTSWTVFPTVNPAVSHNDLYSVSAVSSTNVWAVGAYETNSSSGTTATLAEHWNGASWSKVTTQNPSTYSYLFAVTALSSSNVWAVGSYWNFTLGSYRTLVEHFNGSTWSVIASPNAGLSDTWNQLLSISAWSATDMWAVGSTEPSASPRTSLAMHWNGTSWAIVSTSNLVGGGNEILSVNALEVGHAVGVGYGSFVSGSSPGKPAQWDLMLTGDPVTALPVLATGDVVLEAVARSSDSVWAVGFYQSTPSSPRLTFVWPATWDASTHNLSWASAPGPSASPGSVNNALFGVAAVSPSVFWAVGYANSGAFDQSLAALYCGLHFGLAAPATAVPGSPFSVTVTAKNADTSTATNYRGTVHFTSSDARAVLPANYTFSPGDAGTHTFNGVVLKDTSNQPSTIIASDGVTPFVTGSATITVACIGVCQSPAVTPGVRDAPNPSSGGSSGGRNPIQPRLVAPAARVPQGQAALGSPRAATGHSATPAAPRAIGLRILASESSRAGAKSAAPRTTNGLAVALKRDLVLKPQPTNASSGDGDLVGNLQVLAMSLGLLVFGLMAIRRRNGGEELNFHDKA